MDPLDLVRMAVLLDVSGSQIAAIVQTVSAGHNQEYQTPERWRSECAYGHSAVHPSVAMAGSLEKHDATFPYQHLVVVDNEFHQQPGCAYLLRGG